MLHVLCFFAVEIPKKMLLVWSWSNGRSGVNFGCREFSRSPPLPSCCVPPGNSNTALPPAYGQSFLFFNWNISHHEIDLKLSETRRKVFFVRNLNLNCFPCFRAGGERLCSALSVASYQPSRLPPHLVRFCIRICCKNLFNKKRDFNSQLSNVIFINVDGNNWWNKCCSMV